MNVLVYSGPGTTTEGVKHCLETLRLHLASYYAVLPVNETVLLNEPWMRKTSLLVIPGGADLPYCKVLDGKGTTKISKYVKQGGRFLGFCAGGYFGAARCEFEVGSPTMEVTGPRELGFFPGTAKGCAFKGFKYESRAGARAVKLMVNTAALPGCPNHVYNYYDGGAVFINAEKYKDVEILARYEDKTDVEDAEKAAVVYRKVGKGHVILSGTHPEFASHLLDPRDEDGSGYASVVETLKEHEHNKKVFMRDCLKKLGLRVAESVDTAIPRVTPMYVVSPFKDKVRDMYSNLTSKLELGDEPFQDNNDIFYFADETQEAGEYVGKAKYINFLTSAGIPDSKMVPYFNIQKYFDNLQVLSGGGEIKFGGILGYAEVITSTNTIMDKNPQWLEHLPNGFTITATTQIAGRGRGGNVWVNPRGVLATSVLFKVPPSPSSSSTVVTLQYLCGLALIESILGYGSHVSGQGVGYEDMPLRLKWPNDIFIMKPEYFKSLDAKNDISATVDGVDEKFVKVSGALINSQFINKTFYLVWGGGVNVSNPAPTTSLNLVLEKLNEIRREKGLSPLPPYEPEVLLAKLMFTIDQFYSVFEKSGLQPFLPLYYKRWFHTNQKVEVDNGSGKQRTCIIKGITPDYGLLIAEDVETHKVLHLQPDGNSFDIFRGLVYKKN
ncbi:biotin: apoprotein ligase [includes: biotin-[methylmalonyl-coa-carboxytransferase] ligase (ec 6.3.4.9); biotin-[propionyl-coa-carboxylase [atp-hydrolyzing]] ligase (ec 6.3.4.10) (holocarboxylase synthetase) (hcs); biotin-[methylcrotonoyl-coa-carboxylase] ligase (ec 6.3.4.11); biotin-[acetyl-coa-carboxylase] ligase (ec 6.3.4.15)], putative [Candida dubliniensis CD36]|uniref:BPL/LPL catalytic domain-containing protein n=1 Tax=Candida dubliniensis (strain CD36 / ATCC MYA-646 / CBS 7987 / NCPF 3949 / NRRL Y-17841) TaxID=573826 RepID=B9WN58_CANDC|nr:biotin: apoprotein ligase [includes: biotin-[methylmalonyl-coa-carboxytransferase] ligase (ec 6.3.4.9); biotin-[propionyl-coa-carboxylase [atp-hydrolyzing]] ligase (ec 6.3.4.10) (holocarboxylase synthetase) (hcs); biotin-[methylcrotonoyl-coa-carboxylase] ligase (ec 6.3.4.11); biotin-[acetyl-coa-carboxylase] ligase (ec 6.3.4.15)], putative [Candida dubliniensis CD36]CAX40525.1 biotin: apoprotein ligase [includes: biotin-[methylmalonyl-coa-carboxytransferase] ligase (ec 6.3.4.9); biotin-[propiony